MEEKKKECIVYDYEQRSDVISEAILKSLNYVYSISFPRPEKTFTEICKDIKEEAKKQGKERDENFRVQYGRYIWPCDFYYLPQEVLKEVWDNHKEANGAENYWRNYLEYLMDFLFEKPGFKDVYSPTEWSNGENVKHCEDMPLLKDVIGEEASEKVKEFITSYRWTYKYGSQAENQYAWAFLSTPSCSRENVIKAWKERGVDIEIPEDSYWKNIYEYQDEEYEREYGENSEIDDDEK